MYSSGTKGRKQMYQRRYSVTLSLKMLASREEALSLQCSDFGFRISFGLRISDFRLGRSVPSVASCFHHSGFSWFRKQL